MPAVGDGNLALEHAGSGGMHVVCIAPVHQCWWALRRYSQLFHTHPVAVPYPHR